MGAQRSVVMGPELFRLEKEVREVIRIEMRIRFFSGTNLTHHPSSITRYSKVRSLQG